MARPGPGAEALMTRLADIVVVQVLRGWLACQPPRKQGWVAALQSRWPSDSSVWWAARPGLIWRSFACARAPRCSAVGASPLFMWPKHAVMPRNRRSAERSNACWAGRPGRRGGAGLCFTAVTADRQSETDKERGISLPAGNGAMPDSQRHFERPRAVPGQTWPGGECPPERRGTGTCAGHFAVFQFALVR